MIQNIKKLYGSTLAAIDGEIGRVKDFYFDDKTWVIRYLVADTGSWLSGRLVLLTPHAFGKWGQAKKELHVNLRTQQIENSPPIETHQPVSRQYELDYYNYYGWPAYWDGTGMWGIGALPVPVTPSRVLLDARHHHHRAEKHLQSARAVNGYQIQTVDGPIGTVSGFMVDDQSWAIRELVVEAGHWYSGKEILIAPSKVKQINYEDSTVSVDLTKADIQNTAENHLVHSGE